MGEVVIYHRVACYPGTRDYQDSMIPAIMAVTIVLQNMGIQKMIALAWRLSALRNHIRLGTKDNSANVNVIPSHIITK